MPYYPLDSWFVKVSDNKEHLVALNNNINWKPKSTGKGALEIGSPMPMTGTFTLSILGHPADLANGRQISETKVIGSIEELQAEVDRAVEAGLIDTNPFADFVPVI